MIKLLRSSEIQVSEVENFEISYFPYQNNNSEILEEILAVVILVRIFLDFGVHNFDKSANIEEKIF